MLFPAAEANNVKRMIKFRFTIILLSVNDDDEGFRCGFVIKTKESALNAGLHGVISQVTM